MYGKSPEYAQSDKSQRVWGTESLRSSHLTRKKTENLVSVFSGEVQPSFSEHKPNRQTTPAKMRIQGRRAVPLVGCPVGLEVVDADLGCRVQEELCVKLARPQVVSTLRTVASSTRAERSTKGPLK